MKCIGRLNLVQTNEIETHKKNRKAIHKQIVCLQYKIKSEFDQSEPKLNKNGNGIYIYLFSSFNEVSRILSSCDNNICGAKKIYA